MRALKDPKERAQIQYIGMQKLRSLNDLWNTVQQEPFGFKYGAPRWRLRVLKSSELAKLAGVRNHGGVIAAYKLIVMHKYKCASPKCPSHNESWHICEDFAKKFPNGPLK
jgi:hypothetical protein